MRNFVTGGPDSSLEPEHQAAELFRAMPYEFVETMVPTVAVLPEGEHGDGEHQAAELFRAMPYEFVETMVPTVAVLAFGKPEQFGVTIKSERPLFAGTFRPLA